MRPAVEGLRFAARVHTGEFLGAGPGLRQLGGVRGTGEFLGGCYLKKTHEMGLKEPALH
jgi:hypothetical protein